MSRDWIEFLQSQRLRWQADGLADGRPGVAINRLSHDAASGACSLLVRYPAGFEAAAGTACDPARLVAYLDSLLVPYRGNFHPEFPPGAGRKILYEDPLTGDMSWLLGTLPLRWAERSEVHTTVEEMYLLAGEVHGNRGVMRPGAYFWRPAGIPHGPYETLTGNLYFFRSQGGRLSTTYVTPGAERDADEVPGSE